MKVQTALPDMKQMISGKADGFFCENADPDEVDSPRSRSKTDVPPFLCMLPCIWSTRLPSYLTEPTIRVWVNGVLPDTATVRSVEPQWSVLGITLFFKIWLTYQNWCTVNLQCTWIILDCECEYRQWKYVCSWKRTLIEVLWTKSIIRANRRDQKLQIHIGTDMAKAW